MAGWLRLLSVSDRTRRLAPARLPKKNGRPAAPFVPCCFSAGDVFRFTAGFPAGKAARVGALTADSDKKKRAENNVFSSEKVVGVGRLELPASWSRTKRATKLRYTPKNQRQSFRIAALVAREGFEPSQTESESVVLPLHNRAMCLEPHQLSATCIIIAGHQGLVKGFFAFF